ncbi:hypothetical protein DBR32_02300 [Taibaiella sp. KBW10]|uniref:DUF4349 domain-containing protein n=1 Tax=Taibaiella sp. KBW10 TaxID=2153357 RepID=UPI000F591159|nr:DUF4349 domain-containing protein [Taibaiella sp. KBW10]RQO32457.1 hypothetical protein DBR32_02300 [Taibaiella sp. KBW10]
MKALKSILILVLASAAFTACKQSNNHESSVGTASTTTADEAAAEQIAVDTATYQSSEQRKIIKTADMRSRVKDVLATTTYLEQVTRQLEGSIVSSRLENAVEETYRRPLSSDSVKQVQAYTTTASMTFKIPVQQLDSFLRLVAGQSEFINNRNLALEDVTLNYLSNKLKQEASKANHLAPKTLANVSYIDDRSEQQIDRKIENLSIQEQVKYATLSLDLYQPQRIETKVIANVQALAAPTFGERMRTALYNGWEVIKIILIGITNLWALLLVGGLVWILIRKYKKNKRLIKSVQ